MFPPLPSPTILHLRVGRAPSCASNNRVETPCGSRQRLPHPSRNEQRAISLLLNACHKSPRAPSTPPLPSTSPPSRHSPSLFLLLLHIFLLSTFFPPCTHLSRSFPSFLLFLLVTRVSFPPRPCCSFPLWKKFSEREGGREEQGHGTSISAARICV